MKKSFIFYFICIYGFILTTAGFVQAQEKIKPSPEMILELQKTEEREVLPFNKTFRFKGYVEVETPIDFILDQSRIEISGEMTFEFLASEHDGLAELRLIEDRITIMPISLIKDKWPRFFQEAFTMDEFTIEKTETQILEPTGYVDLRSGNFTMQFTLEFSPAEVPALRFLGIEHFPIIVQETGHMNIKEELIDVDGRVSVPPEYNEIPIFASFWKGGCSTWVNFTGSVDGTKPSKNTTLFILQGEDVYLWWESSEDVTSATITPTVGHVSPTGNTIVRDIQRSTTFEIKTAGGECDKTAKVEVRVVRSGDKIPLSAPYIPQYERFRYVFYKQMCSSKINISYIEPKCGAGCYQHYYKLGTYLNCSGIYCVGNWSGYWIPPGSGLGRPFGVAIMLNPFSKPYPTLVGTWDFLPTTISGSMVGTTAHFTLTVE